MGKRMFYVLKIILQTPHKVITALEIQENLMKQDIKIEIKTVYSLSLIHIFIGQ